MLKIKRGRYITIVAVLIALSMLVVGCGGGAADKGTSDKDQAADVITIGVYEPLTGRSEERRVGKECRSR